MNVIKVQELHFKNTAAIINVYFLTFMPYLYFYMYDVNFHEISNSKSIIK